MTQPIRLKRVEVMGRKVDVSVDEAGAFRAAVDGAALRADTLAELERRIRAALRKRRARVEVQFVHVHRGRYEFTTGIRAGVAVGLHATTDRALVCWEDGKTVQVDRLFAHDCLRPLEVKELVMLRRLIDAKDAADRGLAEFIEARALDVDRVLRQKVAAESERLAAADVVDAAGGEG